MNYQEPHVSDAPEDFDLEERASGVQRVLRGEPEPSPSDAEIPPASLSAEGAVLGHAIWNTAAARELAESLTPDHFWAERHRRIFEAIQRLVAAGTPTQTPFVVDELRRANRLHQVGEEYLKEQVRWHVEEVPIAASIEHLRDLHRRRRAITTMQAMVADGYHSPETTTELLDRMQLAVNELAEGAARRAIPMVTAAQLDEPLPALPWLVPALGIAPGAPVLVAGYGYSRKTLAAQSLLLSVASGLPLWGLYGVRSGPVAHIDWEQGRRLSQERYQRMARALGLRIKDLPIELSPLPDFHIDDRGAEAVLTRTCAGKALVLIDSLRAAAPGVDENSSEVRRPLDMLGRISERTGCVFVVIHHANKPQEGAPTSAKYSIRGSGALFDACSGIFVFVGTKGEPTTVHHEKERNRGVTVEDFAIDADDVPNPMSGDPAWGLLVRHLEAAQVQSDHSRSEAAIKLRRFNEACERVVGYLTANPGATKRGIREGTEGAKDTLDAALEHLLRTGAVVDRGHRKQAAYHVA